jgi:hypothetical protein
MLAIRTALAQEYLAERRPQQQEVHLRSLTFEYLFRWSLITHDWAEHTEAELRRWRDTQPGVAKHRRALKRIRAAVAHDARESRAA